MSEGQGTPIGLDESLLKITKGAGIAFLGSLAGLALGFVGRVLVARIGTEAEYGIFSLALVILNICATIGSLGLPEGAARNIAYARGKGDLERVRKLISASITFGLLAGVALSLAILLSSNSLASSVFHKPALAFPLKVFAFGIPLFVLLRILISLFRGFDDVRPTVIFQNILLNAFFLSLLIPLFVLHLPFENVFYAYLSSLLATSLALVFYTRRRLPFPAKPVLKASFNPVASKLLHFSLPLFGVAILEMIAMWTDTLMLGGLRTSAEVGLYNAARPIAAFISMPLGAIVMIYMPVISKLYTQSAIPEIRRNFAIITKWLCSATFPVFFILFLFPETVLRFLFGGNYAAGADALRILSLGFMIDNLLGPNGATLIALGESRFMMWAALASALINIALNIALIPPLGIEGAALASMIAITSINAIRCIKLYSLSGAHPLSKNLIKPAAFSFGTAYLIYLVCNHFINVQTWMLPLLFILYCGIYSLAVLLTRSFDGEDISLLLAIEKKSGMNFSPLKNLLRRFL